MRCFQPSHSLRSCTLLVYCLASLCSPCAVAGLPAYERAALPKDLLTWPFPAEGAVTDIVHDLRCGLALSPVVYDLPLEKMPMGGEKGVCLILVLILV